MAILRAQAEEHIKYFQEYTMYLPIVLDGEDKKIWQDVTYYSVKDEALNIAANQAIKMYSEASIMIEQKLVCTICKKEKSRTKFAKALEHFNSKNMICNKCYPKPC
jgi:uncharacterized protein